ncbi:hypothetical protein PIB30_019457 [Stylosanthes scabra]|uniref:Transposase n=1 Tax=Stylosanthes scabra TaxID=79078 RepID=A0ABU6S831_9FABA|nr:hypothetical protein [Stylosanthes scabra]
MRICRFCFTTGASSPRCEPQSCLWKCLLHLRVQVANLEDTGTGAPQALCAPLVQRVPDPGVVEALRADDSDDEPPFIEGDSDDDSGLVPNQQGGASSSGTHQYPPHLSTLNLDVLSGPGRVQGEPSSDTRGSQGSNNQAEFQIGQTIVDKEIAILAVKNYSIRRGVEYRVMESDHAKYLGRCKQFGQGADAAVSIKMLRTATESSYDFLPSYKMTWKAKQKAIAQIYGDWDESYA